MENTEPSIRSRFRGLSWDKKHQGWRVRIYYCGKQRHVGRFDDDIAAAKAYDKAAVYLYGVNAITNFGLEACQADTTEVSSFIVMAKVQVQQHSQYQQQEQAAAWPGRSHPPLVPPIKGSTTAGGLIAPLHSTIPIQQLQVEEGLLALANTQQQVFIMPYDAQQVHQLQNHHQETALRHPLGSVATASPYTIPNTSNDVSTMLFPITAAHQLVSMPAGSCNEPSKVFVGSAQQQVVHQQQQQLMTQQQQQQQAHMQIQQLLTLNRSSQPHQLSLHPQATSAVCLSAAAASPLQQQSLQQQLQGVGLPLSLPISDQASQQRQSQLASADFAAGCWVDTTNINAITSLGAGGNAGYMSIYNPDRMQSCNYAQPGTTVTSTPSYQAVQALPAQQQQQHLQLMLGSDCSTSSTWSPMLANRHLAVPAAAPAVSPSLLTSQAHQVQALMLSHSLSKNLTASPAHSNSSSSSSSSASNYSQCYTCTLTPGMCIAASTEPDYQVMAGMRA